MLTRLVTSADSAVLFIAGGLGAIQTAMVIQALPFSAVMVFMGLALVKAIMRDGRCEAHGLPKTHVEINGGEVAQPAE